MKFYYQENMDALVAEVQEGLYVVGYLSQMNQGDLSYQHTVDWAEELSLDPESYTTEAQLEEEGLVKSLWAPITIHEAGGWDYVQ